MNNKTHEALKATIQHFEDAANHSGDAAQAIKITATGLVCLTGLIADLIEVVDALRSKVQSPRDHN